MVNVCQIHLKSCGLKEMIAILLLVIENQEKDPFVRKIYSLFFKSLHVILLTQK